MIHVPLYVLLLYHKLDFSNVANSHHFLRLVSGKRRFGSLCHSGRPRTDLLCLFLASEITIWNAERWNHFCHWEGLANTNLLEVLTVERTCLWKRRSSQLLKVCRRLYCSKYKGWSHLRTSARRGSSKCESSLWRSSQHSRPAAGPVFQQCVLTKLHSWTNVSTGPAATMCFDKTAKIL